MSEKATAFARGRGWARGHVAGLTLLLLALLVGAVSLSYPLGRDQSLYAYVAREWVQRGAIPYRDVYDHKTPGIYLVHAVAISLFGATPWGIRVADLACVAALGMLSARLATPRSMRIAPGFTGLSIFFASVLYYGFFDFWATAQSEIWYTTLGIAAVTAIACDAKESRAQIVAGALGAAAMIMKPPAVGMVAIAFGAVVLRAGESSHRRWARTSVGLARFAAGFLFPVALTLAYFAAHHALAAMADIVIGANSYYVAHERGVQSWNEALVHLFDPIVTMGPVLVPLVFATLGLAWEAHRRGDVMCRRRLLIVLCLLPTSFFAVAMQQKFYWLHWGVIVGPLSAMASAVAYEFLQTRRFEMFGRGAVLVVAGVFFTMFGTAWSGRGPAVWAHANLRAIDRLLGRTTHEAYTSDFFIDYLAYSYRDVDDVNRWLLAHLRKEDETIAARGFNPEIYIYTGRRYVGRFFWTTFLVEPHRAYRRDDYLAEDDAAFKSAPPRYVVTLSFVHTGIDSTEYYVPLGYHEVATFRTLSILERN